MRKIKDYYKAYWFKEHTSSINLIAHKLFIKSAGLAYNLKNKSKLKNTKALKEKTFHENSNKKVFVFANGPSLADIDLLKIANLQKDNFDLIAINSFVSKSAHLAKPDYVVFADKIHFGLKETTNTQYKTDLNWCIENNVTIFTPAQYSQIIKYENNYAFNAFVNQYSENTTNITKPLGFYPLTALYAISIAKFLGYREIYIAGFDNSYFKNFSIKNNNEITLRHPHYYDKTPSETEVDRHWSPTSELFFDFYRHFFYIEKASINSNNIFNISKETYINTIPRRFDLDVYK